DSVRRAVDVIGTLAPVDQVTISSQADGEVRKILAYLGDRVTAGQALVQLDNEKPHYTLDQQQAALARALPITCRSSTRRRTSVAPMPISSRRRRRTTAPASSSSRRGSRSRPSTMRRRR